VHALVIGGGIAGSATALALRSIGADVTVCEARSAADLDAGLWLGVASNGLSALDVLGLRETTLAASLVDPRTGTAGRSGFAPVRRADLYRILRRAAQERGAVLRYDKKLVDADDDGTARFADGSSLTADVVIGCDGVHSRTRSVIDPGAPSPRYIPLLNIGGFAPGARAPGEPARLRFVKGGGGFFGYTTAADRDEVWWFANLPWPTEPTRTELAAMTRDELAKLLLDALDGTPPFVRDVIERTGAGLYAVPTHDLPAVPVWRRGRTILLGDAAHATTPTSGQGASMALEDAVVLATCLRDRPSWPAAAARYEELRRDRVQAIVALGARASAAKLTDASIEDDLEWIHSYRVDWAAPA
jgi:FAD-dependent urate hydroxylase